MDDFIIFVKCVGIHYQNRKSIIACLANFEIEKFLRAGSLTCQNSTCFCFIEHYVTFLTGFFVYREKSVFSTLGLSIYRISDGT